MPIPAYVISGFLDSGKTTLLNRLLSSRQLRGVRLLVVQFESGEEAFSGRNSCEVITFSKRALDQNPKQVIEQLHSRLTKGPPEEIWIEWNGVSPLSQLHSILLHPSLYPLCRLAKLIHMLDAAVLDSLLGKTGGALPEQIAGCDFAVVRGVRLNTDYAAVRRIIRGLNPGVKLLRLRQTESILKEIYQKKRSPVSAFCIGICLFIALYFIASDVFALAIKPVNTVINVYLGIMLQALPFLLIGVLISSVIQVFIPRGAIERRFPKKTVWGIVVAVLMGFCLPVCDCAAIPIFRSLIRKGVPVSAAVTFMTATPVINPVVMLSTYYAFNGSLQIVATRVGLGIIVAVLIGLLFSVLPGTGPLSSGYDGLMCSCGCYDSEDGTAGFKNKLGLFIRHSQAEFFNVGKFLMLGAFAAALFQTFASSLSFQNNSAFGISLFIMMSMAFFLSLCSSSDAVIARSFASSFPLGAIMGFLVFGPMIDLKNVIMLSGSFSKRFIGKLLIVAFSMCYVVVFLLARRL